MSEIRTLSAHADTIYSLIQRQAGSLSKAIGETVMNSIDAFATEVQIQLTPSGLVVIDDGTGFKSKDQITTWFEELGFFHEEGNHRVFGKFGVGRAQLWAYGDSRWTTNEFSMYIDVKKNGLDYDLEQYLDVRHKGVKIESKFYQPLSRSDWQASVDELKEMLPYVGVPITLNGQIISKDPALKRDWTYESDRLWISVAPAPKVRMGRAFARIYNQGVKVQDLHVRDAPDAVVISKPGHQFLQDMSRNSVDVGSCSLWAEAKAVLDKYTTKPAEPTKKPVVSKSARQAEFTRAKEAFEQSPSVETLQGLADSPEAVVHFVQGPSLSLSALLSRVNYRGRRDFYVLGEATERTVALHRAGVFRVIDKSRNLGDLLAQLQKFTRTMEDSRNRPYGAKALGDWPQDFGALPDVEDLPEHGWAMTFMNTEKLPKPMPRLIYRLEQSASLIAGSRVRLAVADAQELEPWCSPTHVFVPLPLLNRMTTSRAAAAAGAAQILQLAGLRANTRDLPMGHLELQVLEQSWSDRRFAGEVAQLVNFACGHKAKHSAKALRALLALGQSAQPVVEERLVA